MQEIDYSVFDKVSGLVIQPLTDKLIRSMAEAGDESLSDTFNRVKEATKKNGIQYFIKRDDLELTAMSKGAVLKCQGEYFDNYEEALKRLGALKN
jgi:hypothetical protein